MEASGIAGMTAESVELKSNDGAKFKSFKVYVVRKDVKKVMAKSFWPVGIKCAFWRSPK